MWGIPQPACQLPPFFRFIPTRVGNTRRRTFSVGGYSVHPHACGEYRVAPRQHGYKLGSSPRVWGIRVGRATNARALRFIPTRVGNTKPCTRKMKKPAVHPHACGEYWLPSSTIRAIYGSSPRVWGIHHPEARVAHYRRFIPTRVGNTEIPDRCISLIAVHPHACGEYDLTVLTPVAVPGSSPRVWGILVVVSLKFVFLRFIPTRVGNTTHRAGRTRRISVHPHACGEYDSMR